MKTRIIVYTLLTLIILSCTGKFIRIRSTHNQTNEELMFYASFVEKASEGALSITRGDSIGFVEHIFRDVIGSCNFLPLSLSWEIDIRQDFWRYIDTNQRILLVAHEIKHCQCFVLFHDDELLDDGCAKSFMTTNLQEAYCSRKHFTRYIEEMKRGCN